MRTKLALASLAAVALVAGSIAPAGATPAAAGPGGFLAGFLTPVVVVTAGEGVTFYNADIAPHDFVSDGDFLSKKAAKKARWCTAFDKGKCPLFWSPKITAGESTEVEGLDKIKSGQYPFFCSVHPGMKGTLIVQ